MLAGCNSAKKNSDEAKNSIQIDFLYAPEKEDWIRNVTGPFNGSGRKTLSGRRIFIKAIPMPSGEAIDAVLSGEQHAHLFSPASRAYIELANTQSRAKMGKDLVASTDNLVLSPVVIATWKPLAEAIGWGKKPVGWSDILTLTHSGRGLQIGGLHTRGLPQP